jgi:hypothetical protein
MEIVSVLRYILVLVLVIEWIIVAFGKSWFAALLFAILSIMALAFVYWVAGGFGWRFVGAEALIVVIVPVALYAEGCEKERISKLRWEQPWRFR